MELKFAHSVALREGWLSQQPEAFQKAVLSRATLREYEVGENIHFAGDDSGGMYGLVSGVVRADLATPEQGPNFVHLLRAGSWFGEGPTIANHPRLLTMIATRRVALLFLSHRAMQDITQLDPSFWRHFIASMLISFDLALVAFSDQLSRSYEKRVAAAILRLGGCRKAAPQPFQPIEIDANQADIAVMASIARTTARAVLQKLEAEKVIKLSYGQIVLLAPNRLRQMLFD